MMAKEGMNMLKYLKINVNPMGRSTGDCSTRAICALLRKSWASVVRLQCEEAIKTGYDPESREVTESLLLKAGWEKQRMPRKGEGKHALKYKVFEMDAVCSPRDLERGVIADVAHHYVYLRGTQFWDIWNSGLQTVYGWFKPTSPNGAYASLPDLTLPKAAE